MYISKIEFWIQKSGFKKKYVAEQVDVSPSQLSHWISGKHYPTVDKAFKLAVILNCKVDDLYEYKKESYGNDNHS